MWKDIPNFEELYEVNEDGEVRNKKTKKLLKGDINNSGYYRVCLYNYSKSKKFFRHRLVAELFLENPNNYLEVNHINGDKSNNNVNNLQWCSRTENEREAHRTGLKKYKPFYVIFDDNVRKEYEFAIDLAKELNLTKRTIQNYLQGKSHGYVKYKIKIIEYI